MPPAKPVIGTPGPWAPDAACRDADPEAFFPEAGDNRTTVAVAKAICETCPVAQQCLDYALANGERYGVWGGLTERERHRINNNLAPLPRSAHCGTEAGHRAHTVRGEKPCSRCRQAHTLAQQIRRVG